MDRFKKFGKILKRIQMKTINGGKYEYCESTCIDGEVFDAPTSPPGGNHATSPCRDHGGTQTTHCE